MPLKYTPGVLSVTLTALRRRRGLLEYELARLANISESMVTLYETEREPSREKLYELAALMAYTVEEVDGLIFALSRTGRPLPQPGSPVDPSSSAVRRIREIAGRAGRALTELLEPRLFAVARTWLAEKARRQAEKLWREIEKTPPEHRRALIETSGEFQTWGLAERLALESEKAASDRADKALALAELGYRTAELSAGDEGFLSAVKGLTLLLLANARRVANQMPKAGEDGERALGLWDAGSEAARKVLPAWRVPDLLGSLRRDQRRFPEALEKLTEARAIAPPEVVSRILVKRAVVLEHMGDPEQAVEVLREAEQLAGDGSDSRHQLTVKHNLANLLCHLGRFSEAEELLPKVRQLSIAGRNELDFVRFVWLRARCDAGCGRTLEARAGFDQARSDFETRQMAYDYALVSLERGELDLREGRFSEVSALAEEMRWIFKTQGIHREALAAITLFFRAVAGERASAGLAQRLVRYLYRAQNDPGLVFEG